LLLQFLKSSFTVGIHLNFLSFSSNSVMGLVVFENPLMNL
jgi:hypothetical protein